jgi:hypothetical protein
MDTLLLRTVGSTRHVQRIDHLDGQRAALIAGLSHATGLAGRPRPLGTSTTERTRKAVTARLREAIHRVRTVLPELGAHLDRSILTGTTCRYEPAEHLTWTLYPNTFEESPMSAR